MAHDEQKGRAALENAAVFSNSFKAVHPWTQSTGFRTHGLRYRTFGASADPHVAEEFLLNTRYHRHDRETELSIQSYFTDRGVTALAHLGEEEPAGLPALALPEGVRLRRDLGDVIRHRQSSRSYTGDPIGLDYLASLLRAAGSVSHETATPLEMGGEQTLRFRTVPSGGGLYPLDIHVAALRIRGLERGLYRYAPLDDALLRVRGPEGADAITGCFAVPDEVVAITRAAAVLLLVGRPWRSMRKYGPRGLRFVLHEAGATAQTVHLAAEALGVGSVDCASFIDDEMHEALGIDGAYQTLLHTVVLGYRG